MKIIVHPFAKPLRNGNRNPKDYPYWKELIEKLSDHEIIQVGSGDEHRYVSKCEFDQPFEKLLNILNQTDLFISIDSFFQHFAHCYNKRGIVLFSKSNPAIFGYPENINLFKDKDYFRPNQFGTWEECQYDEHAFVSPDVVIKSINENFIHNKSFSTSTT